MDGTSFDRIARSLGAGLTRRSGVFGAFGALTGLGAGLPAADGIAAKGASRGNGHDTGKGAGTGRGKDGPGIAGPCGPGKKKNVCKQNSDCCTNICKTKIKNKDKSGRCRCEKKGRPCSEDRNCCGGIMCVAGKCGGKEPAVATGDACTAKSVCQDDNAECTTYQYDTPAGTYCLLPVAEQCAADADCVSSRCLDGSCRPCSSPLCVQACTPTVCATCAYTTVQAAINAAGDDDVIAIGKGLWIEDLELNSKNLTLRACPGDRVTLRNAHYGNLTILGQYAGDLTLLDIVIDGYNSPGSSNYGGGIVMDGSLTLLGTTVVKNAFWWNYNADGGGVRVTGDGLTVTVTDDVAIRNNTSDTYGGGILVNGESDLIISGWAEITGNISDYGGGGVATLGGGVNVTISGNARISGNTSPNGYAGGGLCVYHPSATRATTVTIEDDVVIADNQVLGEAAGGILIYGASTGPVTVAIADRVKITGNRSSSRGGGLALQSWFNATISGEVEISGNRSDNFGGGISARWGSTTAPHLTITDTVSVAENIATSGGGGVFAEQASVDVVASAVIAQNSGAKGGGVYLKNGSSPSALTVSAFATITGNTATDASPSGGGVYSDDNANTLSAVAGSITGNTPDQCEGGSITC